MGVVTKLVEMLSGGLGSTIVDTVRAYFPASMSEKEKSDLEMRILEASHAHELALLEAATSADKEFNQRMKDMEGTAADLIHIPVLGSIILFLRGCQRPMFGYFTFIMDYCVFSGAWVIPDGSRLEIAFFTINLLVLGFLFGERAIKNVAPLLQGYVNKGGK